MEQPQLRRIGPRIYSLPHTQPTPYCTEPDAYAPERMERSTQIIHNKLEPIQSLNSPRGLKRPQEHFSQPKITIPELFIEAICITILGYNIAYFVDGFESLPEWVNINFDPDTTVNQVNKNYLLLLIAGDIFAYLLMVVLQLLPHKFKYLVEVTKENCQQVFLTTRCFILWYKLVTVSMVLYASYALFNIINREWEPKVIYLLALAGFPYLLGGYCYYKRLIHIMINPYA